MNDKYVITRLNGGLGNQLFQYAAGLSLAARLNADLLVHMKRHRGEINRPDSLLKVFPGLKLKKASFSEITKALGYKYIKFFSYFTGNKSSYNLKHYYNEPYYHFSNEINLIDDSVYINGHFQSEKYFCENKKLIKNLFIFEKKIEDRHRDISEYFKKNNCISVHIRRGDYLSNPVTNKYHGVLGHEYYQRAIKYILGKVRDPKFIFFSDDAEYIEKVYGKLQDPVFKRFIYQRSTADDLFLMSKCKHHIIANSTFSWWGAWLSDFPEKVVVAPKVWFAQSHNDTKDLMPESWVRL